MTNVPFCCPSEIDIEKNWHRVRWPCGVEVQGTDDVRVVLREHVCPSIPSDIGEGPTPSLVSVAGKRTGRRNAKVTAPCLPPKQPNDKGNE